MTTLIKVAMHVYIHCKKCGVIFDTAECQPHVVGTPQCQILHHIFYSVYTHA